jgi:hypothetical protein
MNQQPRKALVPAVISAEETLRLLRERNPGNAYLINEQPPLELLARFMRRGYRFFGNPHRPSWRIATDANLSRPYSGRGCRWRACCPTCRFQVARK